jgi:4-amino-4-deoxy-L-arabinose transferase-like glycosyltransferase
MNPVNSVRGFIEKFKGPILIAACVTFLLSENFSLIFPEPVPWVGAILTILACLGLYAWLERHTLRPNLIFLVLVFMTAGYILVAKSEGASVFTWMNIYRVEDIKSFSGLLHFFKNLRIPVPPVLGVLEYGSYVLSGSTGLVTRYGYQLAILASLLFCILLARRSVIKMYLVTAVGLFLVLCIRTVHSGNPQIYDIFFPLFVMGYIFCLEKGTVALARLSKQAGSKVWLAVAGFCLALADLSRPFFIVILLVVVVLTALRLKPLSARSIVWFLLPILILSLSWHAYQWGAFRQITWSNNTGFSLWRVWQLAPDMPLPDLESQLVMEIHHQPVADGRWDNLNTAEHSQNSRTLTAIVLNMITQAPVKAVDFIRTRVVTFLFMPSVDMYNASTHKQDFLTLYKLLVVGLSLNLVYAMIRYVKQAATTRLADWSSIFSSPRFQLVLITFLSALSFALSEAGEESRFMISLLPMMLACGFMSPVQEEA